MAMIELYFGNAMRVALAVISTMLMIVSVKAYGRKPEMRYLLLMLAFVFLCIATVSSISLELVGWPTVIPFFEAYLIPSLELLMVISFLVAVVWSSRLKRPLVMIFLAALIVVGLFVATAYTYESAGGAQSILPAGCVKPTGGFLIIASSLGYNDSIAHGAPAKNWPVLEVSKGTDVNITVCNTYPRAVGFQVTHYLEDRIEYVPPGEAISVNFNADRAGTFLIYCSTFNPIHIYLQGGELNVL